MSIDFSQVKTITIPEGSVTKITDSNGNILWQAGGQSEDWHTIWEGNKTITVTKSGNSTPVFNGKVVNLAQTAIGTGTAPKLRITFSYSNTNTDSSWENGFFIESNFKPESSVSSPFTIKLKGFIGTNICCIGCRQKYGDTYIPLYLGLRKKFSFGGNPNNNITINLEGYADNNISNTTGGDFTLTFTVTKIEQYY